MKLLLCFIHFMIMSKILTTYSQEATLNGLGKSSCTYDGFTDANCNLDDSAIYHFPDSCTSFVFKGLRIDRNCKISTIDNPEENGKALDNVCGVGKNVFAHFSHDNYSEWITMLAGLEDSDDNALNEAKAINDYLKLHKGITGLLITNLEPDSDSPEFCGFTEYLTKYIDILKRETKLEIGVLFISYYFYLYYSNQTAPQWLDFPALNPTVCIYYFSLFSFYNECTDKLSIGGVYPIDGDAEFTLEKLSSVIDLKQVPRNKTVFSYTLVPKSRKPYDNMCVLNNERLCKFPDKTKDWCSDTQESLFKKGQWIKDHGVGINGNYMNIDDPQGCCGCGPFPGFNAILAGFNGSPSAPSCPLFDRV